MARVLGLLLLFSCLGAAGCAERDNASSTATPEDGGATTVDASGSPTDRPFATGWTGELSGAVTGEVTGTLTPECGVSDDTITVTLVGVVNVDSVSINVRSGGPGTFNPKQPADESPSIDVATAGESEGEWSVVAGQATEDGDLTLKADGSGSLSATLPSITAGGQPAVTVTADWACAGG